MKIIKFINNITTLHVIYYKFKKFLHYLTHTKVKDKDLTRQAFILNVLLLGSILLTFCAALSSLVGAYEEKYIASSTIIVIIILILLLVAYFFAKKGKVRLIAYLVILFYLAVTTLSAYQWGADFSQGVITYCMIVIMSGILVSSRFAFFITTVISLILIILIYLQEHHYILVNSSWRQQPATVRDGFILSITLFIVALIAWLSNREMEKALRRARASESALRKQRDLLEITVDKRTQELKQIQMEKIMQMYKFTEFGKLAAGLFHDLVEPLNLVVLNLDELVNQHKHLQTQELQNASVLLERAVTGTKRMESFVKAARQQMQHQEIASRFSPIEEIQQTLLMFAHRTKEAKIKITFLCQKPFPCYGSPVKFRQVITNLLSNAIDSYEDVKKNEKREIVIQLKKANQLVKFSIQDFGCGMEKKHLEHIFDPWFTTKKNGKGTGIGLYIVKDIVERYFHGKISVMSKMHIGTKFSIEFPIKKKNN